MLQTEPVRLIQLYVVMERSLQWPLARVVVVVTQKDGCRGVQRFK